MGDGGLIKGNVLILKDVLIRRDMSIISRCLVKGNVIIRKVVLIIDGVVIWEILIKDSRLI